METGPSTSLDCVLIDDIILHLVDLHILNYGISRIINKLIDNRNKRDGLDASAALCVRMIDSIDDALITGNKKSYELMFGSEIDLHFGTKTLTKYMNDKYGSKRFLFLYLAFRIVLIEWNKKNCELCLDLLQTFADIEHMNNNGTIDFNGRDTPKSLASKRSKLLFMIRVSNMFSAMCDDDERYSEEYTVNSGWFCTDCGESIDICSREPENHNSRTMTYEYKHKFSLRLYLNNNSHFSYPIINVNTTDDNHDDINFHAKTTIRRNNWFMMNV